MSLAPYVAGRVDIAPDTVPVQTGIRIVQQALQAVNTDPRMHEAARRLVRHLVDEKEPGLPCGQSEILAKLAEIQAVDVAVQQKIRYTHDPHGVELMYHPSALLDPTGPTRNGRWAEDCDTCAALTLAYLLSLGHSCRVTLAGFAGDAGFSHVFVEDYVPAFGWLIVDPALGFPKVVNMAQAITHSTSFFPEEIANDPGMGPI